ncbi:hypothetical protein LOTGIDRAFT_231222 [Lottia gigantea]|uniref:DUF885 domain-containing protein n=1 Tax=Lottia gigantea TaxID=225164 RepID=V4CAN5_LOTGI|nr:hypothetical protein LOTGIDRAFT_231222 [Lottia gigantea]ESO98869.1 hypothetical protein LOTGIDRAFT_231222 [Lottia gigantea]
MANKHSTIQDDPCLCKDAFGGQESDTLKRLQDAVYKLRFQSHPEFATFFGVHDFDDRLEAYTMESYRRRKEVCEEYLKLVEDVDINQLTRVERRELRILKSYLQAYIEGYEWRDYGALNPINFLEGITAGPHWTLYSRLKTKDDYQNYLKRLASVPKQVDQEIALMEKAIRLKRTSHKVSVDRVPKMIENWPVYQIYLYPFRDALEESRLSIETRNRLQRKAEELLVPINKSLKRFQKFMEKEYAAATRPSPGVHSYPNGEKYYRACLKWYLGYEITPEEIFEIGVKEVDRIERKMKKIMESVGFPQEDLKSFFQYAKYIPKFYNHSKEELLAKYQGILNHDIRPKLPRLFYNITLPKINIVPVENDGPWGSYGQNVFYVNLKDPRKRSTFMMLPLAVHETDPGHHFQEAYTALYDVPAYRSHSMISKLYSVPLHFPVYSAYTEGWALYAEYLGTEMGLYKDPFEMFGKYCSEIFRACRLVVDTGIHAFGWTRERAIKFLESYSDFPKSQIEAEIDRYITWPGQACAYKIGEMKIIALRRKAEKILGRDFNIREFHHEVLSTGSVPLDILEEIITDWISAKQAWKINGRYGANIDRLSTNSGSGISHNNGAMFLTILTFIFCGLT